MVEDDGVPVRRRMKRARENTEGPLIFLDVDGVLNCAASRAAAANLYLTEKITWEQKLAADAAAPSLLTNLVSLIQQTEAKVVLSSTWRLADRTRDVIEERLRASNIEIIGVTPEATPSDDCAGADGEFSPEVERAIEIMRWLQVECAVESPWIAIDDMDLVGEGGGRMQAAHFVHTDDGQGLTPAKAEEAAEKLLAQRGKEMLASACGDAGDCQGESDSRVRREADREGTASANYTVAVSTA